MSSDSLVVMSPVTGERVATVPNMDTAAIGDMARRARAAQPAWARLGFAGRARVLRPLARWLLDHSDDVFRVVCSETGKQYEDVLLELGGVVSALQFWSRHAKRYLAEQKYRSASPFVLGKKLRISYVPRGVAGVIAPWNFPLALGFGDSIPALMAGNSVILKPSEITPLSIEVIARGLIECGLPNNVFQIATGSAETGEALIDEADVIMFTGSTATGKKVLARAAETLTPVTTELGGKDAMIVLADADLERSANLAVYGSMLNGGQVCMSIERAYVHEDIYDEFVRCVVDKVDKLRVGPPAGFGRADIGAISSPAQMDVIERQVRNSEAMGAQILVGGQRKPGWGNYFEPTVLTEVNHDMECMR
ncbi:MAG: aldehyde dehydrogenase family protein, partial [Mycobacterium sp.]